MNKKMENPVLRTFIAIEISDEVRSSLTKVQKELKKADAKVSWVPPENVHLSLVFLGDIFETMVEKLASMLDAEAGKTPPFGFVVDGIGSFGSPRKPRVLWAGLADPPDVLSDLYRRVADGVRALGMPVEDRSYRPHITLGRVRSSRNVDSLTSAMGSAKNTRHGSVDVHRLLLMRSQLTSSGARYSVLHESLLKGEHEL